MSLSELYFAELYLAHAGSALDAPALEAALRAFCGRAALERPELRAFANQDLVAHLARRTPPGSGGATGFEQVRAGDLLLAFACARRAPAAIAAFERELLATDRIAAAVSRIDSSPAFVDEVRQTVREKLLVAKPGEEPRIAEYSGRGTLASWTQVVAMRAALDLRPARAQQGSDAIPDLGGDTDPEMRILQERYGKAFERAITQAFATLDDEQTNLLRLQIVDGLQTARIAALFHVDRSTIKRRLAECREALLGETRRILGDELGASPDSLESILRLVRSQLHVSVARLLTPKRAK